MFLCHAPLAWISLENVEKDLSKLANTSNLDRLVAVVNEQKRATANIKVRCLLFSLHC